MIRRQLCLGVCSLCSPAAVASFSSSSLQRITSTLLANEDAFRSIFGHQGSRPTTGFSGALSRDCISSTRVIRYERRHVLSSQSVVQLPLCLCTSVACMTSWLVVSHLETDTLVRPLMLSRSQPQQRSSASQLQQKNNNNKVDVYAAPTSKESLGAAASSQRMCFSSFLNRSNFVVFYRSQCSRQTVPDSWAGDCERSITEPYPGKKTRAYRNRSGRCLINTVNAGRTTSTCQYSNVASLIFTLSWNCPVIGRLSVAREYVALAHLCHNNRDE